MQESWNKIFFLNNSHWYLHSYGDSANQSRRTGSPWALPSWCVDGHVSWCHPHLAFLHLVKGLAETALRCLFSQKDIFLNKKHAYLIPVLGKNTARILGKILIVFFFFKCGPFFLSLYWIFLLFYVLVFWHRGVWDLSVNSHPLHGKVKP